MAEPAILVLGGGPAGAAVAMGLSRLGFPVTVVTSPRPFDALEGVSERVIEGMKNAGFSGALEVAASASPRQVSWNGQASAANTERLIPRDRFDQKLGEDLQKQGIEVIRGRVTDCRRGVVGWQAEASGEDGKQYLLQGDFLVEARGRAAPAAGMPRVQGSRTLSLLQYWQGPEANPCSAVESFEDGWAWMAMRADGRRYLQLTVDAVSAGLPPKHQLAGWCRDRLQRLEQARPFLRGAQPAERVYARTSTPVLCEHSVGEDWIRVGDAAMAVDPLSGNGIFQALSSALQAPAVVNTLIRHPERAGLAKQFHEARIEGLFYRFARIGRDFYAQETRWRERSFWQARCRWPDSEPMHRQVSPEQVTTAYRPVLNGGVITREKVVVTPDQPMGVWHLGGLALAELLEAVWARPEASPEAVLVEQLGPGQGKAMAAWMSREGWVEPPAYAKEQPPGRFPEKS